MNVNPKTIYITIAIFTLLGIGFAHNAHAVQISTEQALSCRDIEFTDMTGYNPSTDNMWIYNTESGVYIGYPSDNTRTTQPSLGDNLCYTDDEFGNSTKKSLSNGSYSVIVEGEPYNDNCGSPGATYNACKFSKAFKNEVLFNIQSVEELSKPEPVIPEQNEEESPTGFPDIIKAISNSMETIDVYNPITFDDEPIISKKFMEKNIFKRMFNWFSNFILIK